MSGAATQVGLELGGVAPGVLGESLEVCRDVVRARARNFYYGLKLTPEPKRGAIYSLYAWMRLADDLADDTGRDEPARRAALAEHRTRTQAVLGGDTGESYGGFWPAFAATVRTYPIDPALFESMLEGLETDLGGVELGTEEELRRYCYCVASTVGLACVAIWGVREGVDPEEVTRKAIARGQGFQRTNILRDFAEDYDETPRRVYVSRESFDAAGLSAEALRRWSDAAACERFVRSACAVARSEYEASAGLEEMIDPACRPTLWAMTRIYRGLLEVIEREPSRIALGPRVRLAAARKATIAVTASVRSRLARA